MLAKGISALVSAFFIVKTPVPVKAAPATKLAVAEKHILVEKRQVYHLDKFTFLFEHHVMNGCNLEPGCDKQKNYDTK